MEHFELQAGFLDDFVKRFPKFRSSLQPYLAKQIWPPKDRQKMLNLLSGSILNASCNDILDMAKILEPLIEHILMRCEKILQNEAAELGTLCDDAEINCDDKFIVILGKLCESNIDCVKRYTHEYLRNHKCPFLSMITNEPTNLVPQRKKRKVVSLDEKNAELLHAIDTILQTCPELVNSNWEWEKLFEQLPDLKLSSARWHMINIISSVMKLCSHQKQNLMLTYLTNEDIKKFTKISIILHATNENDQSVVDCPTKLASHTQNKFLSMDVSQSHIAVAGVLLKKHRTNKALEVSTMENANLVMTESLLASLRKTALSVQHNCPVILQGPVGCGKTSLVEYLAHECGRYRDMVKIQLGDDTDSKMLTGTYACTAVPGEFVWQPGALTRAVMEGHWVLMEDIESAPLDVISLLVPLVESGHLSIPGRSHDFKDTNVFSNSGFKLFLTHRCTEAAGSSESLAVNYSMLSKHCTVVKMSSLSICELKQIISQLQPNLDSICDKLLKIYSQLTPSSINKEDSHSLIAFDYISRKPSTRDLIKWAYRVSDHMKMSGKSSFSDVIVNEAMDCFVAPLMSQTTRLAAVKMICSELSVPSEKAEYLYFNYKPDVEIDKKFVKVGRVVLHKDILNRSSIVKQPFAMTRHASVLMEQIASAVALNEPVLLVGETGVGKTSAIQFLSQQLGKKLVVVNMSQQSSASDLLGGYKPIQPKHLVVPIREEFERIFNLTFSRKQNEKFLRNIQLCFNTGRYQDLIHLMAHCIKPGLKRVSQAKDFHKHDTSTDDYKMQVQLQTCWKKLQKQIESMKHQLKTDSALAFNFVDGTLAQAVRNGDWLLLDEINLAASETLECLSSLLESKDGSVVLLERGDVDPVKRHPEFRLFSAMNPATDVGKQNLPEGVRNRLTELFVAEPNDMSDLRNIIAYYLDKRSIVGGKLVDGILSFYCDIRSIAEQKLSDNTGHKPHFSLRTLCRALRYVCENSSMSVMRSLYEGLCLSFLTEIERKYFPVVISRIMQKVMGGKNLKSIMSGNVMPPTYPHVTIEQYCIRKGPYEPNDDPAYIITDSVKENLKLLARPVSYGKYPILIQGETSTGKTSLIRYLAHLTGNKVVRINNHEHTDLQEYIGCYSSDKDGHLVFQEGPLVTAMREGYWVILDELNLAPTDILEALNRVLDDNRELFIPETQELVQAHPRFTLFATQNPPGTYGGRKVLSRALRNRFIELHFGDIPVGEVKTILHKRCQLPLSRCVKLVKVMQELQAHRRTSGIFAGKHGFITLRDLFRWAERYRRENEKEISSDFYDWDQHLANDGFMLLAGRVRNDTEEKVIKEVIEKHMKKKIDVEKLFGMEAVEKLVRVNDSFKHVVWTYSMRRLCVMLNRSLQFDEPVLLVGETGCGKTTACQMLAASQNDHPLQILNCHSHIDASDFLGGLRPVRSHSDNTSENSGKLFEWSDGPLVTSMQQGGFLLVDEISLADDSVLERLNSVLEPERLLNIPDKMDNMSSISEDSSSTSVISATDGFQFLATMNPGGDFGKKELSPALRNRFTEIWCTPVNRNKEDLKSIISHNLTLTGSNQKEKFSKIMVEFVDWFTATTFGNRYVVSIRDIMKWVEFINVATHNETCQLSPEEAFMHAASLVYIDGLGTGFSSGFSTNAAKDTCIKKLEELLKTEELNTSSIDFHKSEISMKDNCVGMRPFYISHGIHETSSASDYTFATNTVSQNASRVFRALQLRQPVLLEGSPGVGKTSLVAALAKASGNRLVRINLSEQTDMSDLFGADLPVEDGIGGQFQWRDGPLLAALKNASWVVLDELNLASQSVLEGLNSVFDHRGEIFIPELGKTFKVQHEKTFIFACQNPLQQGGGRKGLPKSFLNRFTQVYMESLSDSDLLFILQNSFPRIPENTLAKMIEFNKMVCNGAIDKNEFGYNGAPWEFNLRDMSRWCELLLQNNKGSECSHPGNYVYLIYSERMRTATDRQKIFEIYNSVFNDCSELYQPSRVISVSNKEICVGNAVLHNADTVTNVFHRQNIVVVPSLLHSLESIITVLNRGWMCILTGPSGSGKTTVMRALSQLSGNKLDIFPVNSNMDTTELLGGFEQADPVRKVNLILDEVIFFINQNVKHSFLESQKLESNMSFLMEGIRKIKACQDSLRTKCKDNETELICIKQCKDAIDMLTKFVQNHNLTQLIPKLKDAIFKIDKIITALKKNKPGTYEWVDSILVDALTKGYWLMIDGANLCHASVLDRLNALLEPKGTLAVTERGVIDGSIPEIKPHTNFRLILSMDPSKGELSRAMRNRGVEIFMLGSNNIEIEKQPDMPLKAEDIDIMASILGSIQTPLLPSKIAMFIKQTVQDHASITYESPSSQTTRCVKCCHEVVWEVKSGNSLSSAIVSVCSNNLRFSKDEIQAKMTEFYEHDQYSKTLDCKSELPVVTVQHICDDPQSAKILTDGLFFVDLKKYSSLSHLSYDHLLNAAFTFFTNLSTRKDWQSRITFLKQISDIYKTGDDLSILDLFLKRSAYIFNQLKSSEESGLCWDVRWDPQLAIVRGAGVEQLSNANKLLIMAKVYLLKERMRNKVKLIETNCVLKRGVEFNLFSQSVLFHLGKMRRSDLSHSTAVHLQTLFNLITLCLEKTLVTDSTKQVTIADTVQMLNEVEKLELSWRYFLQTGKFELSSFILNLMITQKAVNKICHTVHESSKLSNILNTKCYRELNSVVKILEEDLGIDSNSMEMKLDSSLKKHFSSGLLQALPFHDHREFALLLFAKSLLKFLISKEIRTANDRLKINELIRTIVRLSCSRIKSKICNNNSDLVLHFVGVIRLYGEICKSNKDFMQDKFKGDFEKLKELFNFETDNVQEIISEEEQHNQMTSLGNNFFELSQSINLQNLFYSFQSCVKKQGFNDIVSNLDNYIVNVYDFEQLLSLLSLKETLTLSTWNSITINHVFNQIQSIITMPQDITKSNEDVKSSGSTILQPTWSQILIKNLYEISTNPSILDTQTLTQQLPIRTISVEGLKLYNKIEIPLKDWKKNLQKLRTIQTVLWRNSDAVSYIDGLQISAVYFSTSVASLLDHMISLMGALLSSKCDLLSCKEFDVSTHLKEFCERVSKIKIELSNHPRRFKLIQHKVNELHILLKSVVCKTNNGSATKPSHWLTEMRTCLKEFINSVLLCLKSVFSYNPLSTAKDKKKWQLCATLHCSISWIWGGITKMFMTFPSNVLDPVERHRFKEGTAVSLKNTWECHTAVYNLYHNKVRGRIVVNEDLSVNEEHLLHPLVSSSAEMVAKMNSKYAKVLKKVAYRPQLDQYHQLYVNSVQLLTSIGNSESISALVKHCQHILDGFDKPIPDVGKETEIFFMMSQRMQTSFNNFVKQLDNDFIAFPDVTIPMKDSIYSVQYGLCLASSSVAIIVPTCRDVNHGMVPELFFRDLMSNSYYMDNCVNYISMGKQIAMNHAVEEENAFLAKNINERVTITLLLKYYQEVMQEGPLTPKLCNLLGILEIIANQWHLQQDEIKRREEEKSSLYKPQQHLQDLAGEAANEEKEFEQTFPQYQEEIEGSPEDQETKEKNEDILEPESATWFTDHSFQLAIVIHKQIANFVKINVKTNEQKIKKMKRMKKVKEEHLMDERHFKTQQLDIASLFGHLHLSGAFTHVSSRMLGSLFETNMLSSNILTTKNLEKFLSESKTSLNKFNLYHDATPAESCKCLPILSNYKSHIQDKLLPLWPDNPTLVELVEIIDRITSFTCTSPLMKFVAGLEFLLTKSQEWESNASNAVSVQDHLIKITNLVLEWRKAELKSWNALLDNAEMSFYTDATKWWFYLYNLTLKNNDDFDEDELVQSLQTFMETSSLADFKFRMELLLNFYKSKLLLEHDDEMMIVLWNIYSYYNQFTVNVTSRVKSIRDPLEKELKDFIKISKWNDINFYAAKESILRTHKFLHKTVKKYKTLLQEPIKVNILTSQSFSKAVETQSQQEHGSSASTLLSLWRNNLQLQTEKTKSDVLPLQKFSYHNIRDDSMIMKFDSIYIKLSNHIKSWQNTNLALLPNLIELVNEFSGDIISSAAELHALQPNTPAGDKNDEENRKKRLSEAKHIQQRKRKAFADLFKALSDIGLSYKKGIILGPKLSFSKAMQYPVAPCYSSQNDFSVDKDKTFSEEKFVEILTISTESYFYKLIGKWSILHPSMLNPHKELGQQNISQMKGFTNHLIKISFSQRKNIAKLTKAQNKLNKLLQPFIRGYKDLSYGQSNLCELMMHLKQAVDGWIYTVKKLENLFASCPDTDFSENKNVVPEFASAAAKCVKHDENWTQIMNAISTSVKFAENVKQNLNQKLFNCLRIDDMDPSFICKEPGMIIPVEYLHEFGEMIESMVRSADDFKQCVFPMFNTSSSDQLAQTTSAFLLDINKSARLLNVVKGEITTFISQGETMCSEEDVEQHIESANEIIEAVLVSLQQLFKSNTELKKSLNQEETDGNDGNGINCDEQLLKIMHEHIHTQCKQLRCDILVWKFETFVESVISSGKSEVYPVLLNTISSLFMKYYEVVCQLRTSLIMSHRTLCKLSSILSSLFSQLAVDGFCTPAEFEEEMSGDGATEFKDVEGGGIGEGEGVKDVSEEIENEEQVEDKPGEEKDEDNDDDVPESEEHGIEMSHDFEGKFEDQDRNDDENSDSDNEMENEDIDKQMGDLGEDADADKLDERLWGSDDENEEENENESKEERGKGMDKSETELGAKEEGLEEGAEEDDKKDKPEEPEHQENADNSEFDPNQRDDYEDNENKEDEKDKLDLPEDINLDEAGETEKDKEENDVGKDNENIEAEVEESKEDENESIEQANISDDFDENQNDEVEENIVQPGEEAPEKDDKEGEEIIDLQEEETKTNEEEFPEEKDNDNDAATKNDNENNNDKPECDVDETNKSHGIQPQIDDNNEEDEKMETNDRTHRDLAKENEDDICIDEDAMEGIENTEQDRRNDPQLSGAASSENQQGHDSENMTSQIASENVNEHIQEEQISRRKTGENKSKRTLDDSQEKVSKRLKTIENATQSDVTKDNHEDSARNVSSELYEHIDDKNSSYDKKTLDAVAEDEVEEVKNDAENDDVEVEIEEGKNDAENDLPKMDINENIAMENQEDENATISKENKENQSTKLINEDADEERSMEIDSTNKIAKEREGVLPDSTIHTKGHLITPTTFKPISFEEISMLRQKLEEELRAWSDENSEISLEQTTSAWHQYINITQPLAQQLTEQLRLTLEPTLAAKLKGDYRTGKRLNMRKVIPYIASGFRKDKIWLRRSKPSKRQYQIMVALDDSSSMIDNHSKQLAFESLAVISKALTTLEAGQLAVASFGETTKLLHEFTKPFTDQSGAEILAQCKFAQENTKIAQFLGKAQDMMLIARSMYATSARPNTSQLLLIISDGRGLYTEGKNEVTTSIRNILSQQIFVVFVIIDKVKENDSILDIKVPIFKEPGQLPEIRSYMEDFPFPYYMILRDINALPHTLGDALRQWFELINTE